MRRITIENGVVTEDTNDEFERGKRAGLQAALEVAQRIEKGRGHSQASLVVWDVLDLLEGKEPAADLDTRSVDRQALTEQIESMRTGSILWLENELMPYQRMELMNGMVVWRDGEGIFHDSGTVANMVRADQIARVR